MTGLHQKLTAVGQGRGTPPLKTQVFSIIYLYRPVCPNTYIPTGEVCVGLKEKLLYKDKNDSLASHCKPFLL